MFVLCLCCFVPLARDARFLVLVFVLFHRSRSFSWPSFKIWFVFRVSLAVVFLSIVFLGVVFLMFLCFFCLVKPTSVDSVTLHQAAAAPHGHGSAYARPLR